jgi:ribonucleoside-diphosphate reductase alpha chain
MQTQQKLGIGGGVLITLCPTWTLLLVSIGRRRVTEHGPTLRISEETHKVKYRLDGESFREMTARVANTLADGEDHYDAFRDALLDMRFLPGGRVQSSIGSPRGTTAFNCYVSGSIDDSMVGIMQRATEAAETMRLGGGIGYDFSTIRPSGDRIVSLDAASSGPLSFMEIFNSVCKTVASAGNRRGAQMGVMRVDHPDIEKFIEAKANTDQFTQFNLSVAVTDEFMEAVENGTQFDLTFEGRVYSRVDARYLYDKIMRATWDWAEPGILYIDHINRMNNLWYCETISATNPCGEQPLPPYGACLLGSFNLVKYLEDNVVMIGDQEVIQGMEFDYDQLKKDVAVVVRAMDNVIENTTFPLPEQAKEAQSKRRMGLGVTGEANAIEALGHPYGSGDYLETMEEIHRLIANEAYRASAELAKEKGAFPLYEERYLDGHFIKRLDDDVVELITSNGMRNSHLLSIAPTGTISLCADNVSSSIEPVFSYGYDRTINTDDGPIIERVDDYGFRELGVSGITTDRLSPEQHLSVLQVATKWSDSAVSKTINVGDDVTWEEFTDIYMKAWKLGCKGVTTFRPAGKRYGILNKAEDATACYIDPETGKKECS